MLGILGIWFLSFCSGGNVEQGSISEKGCEMHVSQILLIATVYDLKEEDRDFGGDYWVELNHPHVL